MDQHLNVKFVATDGPVWEGEATSVLVRTQEGDLGILPGHVPLMAVLVPHGAEVVSPDGQRHIVAVDSGFVSVFDNHVSVLSAYGEMAHQISVDQARIAQASLAQKVSQAEATEEEVRLYRRLLSQIKAAEKYEKLEH